MDNDKQVARPPIPSAPAAAGDRSPVSRVRSDRPNSDISSKPETDELYDLLPELRPPKLSPEAIAAAMQAMQIEPDEMEAVGKRPSGADAEHNVCRACGRSNRRGNRFCAMCGTATDSRVSKTNDTPADWQPNRPLTPEVLASSSVAETSASAPGTHHYHHHYHHFSSEGQEGFTSRQTSAPVRDTEKLRVAPSLKVDSMSRGEAAVRRVTQEWVLACNTKHLDDLLDLYSPDALVMRANYPSVRGSAAIREFFFSALDSGLGEVEVEPLRVEVVGGIAYEAGRCKALVSGGAAGKRREDRGKYLWVLVKQDNGEWKLAADCWSSDLTLTAEAEIALVTGNKPGTPRKNS